jgi:hypothetical protein
MSDAPARPNSGRYDAPKYVRKDHGDADGDGVALLDEDVVFLDGEGVALLDGTGVV